MLFQHGWWYGSSKSFKLVLSKNVAATPSLQILFCLIAMLSKMWLCDTLFGLRYCSNLVPKPQPAFHALRLSHGELYPNRVLQEPRSCSDQNLRLLLHVLSTRSPFRSSQDEILEQLERLANKAEQDGDLECEPHFTHSEITDLIWQIKNGVTETWDMLRHKAVRGSWSKADTCPRS